MDEEWLADYQGLSADECRRLADQQGRPVRVLGPGDVVTLEYRVGRVNVSVDDAGRVERIYAG